MEADVLKYGWMIILTLAQIVLVAFKVLEKRNGKKNNKSHNPGNPGYGERIASLETEVGNMKDGNKEDHELIRKNIEKLFTFFNGTRK